MIPTLFHSVIKILIGWLLIAKILYRLSFGGNLTILTKL